jgi:hypothetical protein
MSLEKKEQIFSQILAEKLNKGVFPSENVAKKPQIDRQSLLLTQLFIMKTPYAKKPQLEVSNENSPYPRARVEKPKPKWLSSLTPRQKDAVLFFIENGYFLGKKDLEQARLKKAFRRLARKLHPDTVATESQEILDKATEDFKALFSHYSILKV